ncbi:MAG: MerR family transcriptional regulator [Flavobacteriales bacterium]|jgi:DNA-binding transcriptional MerR regulator|nr:MerR family transcriptional regulator [Flavobacteriales bacterium]
MQQFSIKDLENFTGIKAHTIRAWEQRYELLAPNRTDTNIRFYTGKELKLLLNIGLLNKLGYKISKIAEMSEEEMQEAISAANNPEGQEAHFLNMLKLAMLNYDEDLFHEIADRFLEMYSIRETFGRLFLPFMQHVGVLWLTSAICPAQEHFISNLIRQKLFSLTDALKEKKLESSEDERIFVMYLPEQEIHDISILLSHLLLREAGKKTIFLGQSVPFEDLVQVEKKFRKVHFVSICTTHPSNQEVDQYLQRIKLTFAKSDCQFHFTGPVFTDISTPDAKHISFYQNANVMLDALLA